MGIQADTATAVPDLLPDGADGFTSGDPQAGIAPTQVSPTFLNSIVTELNNIVTRVGDDPLAFATEVTVAWKQCARAIINRIAFARGDAGYMVTNPAWYRRTYSAEPVVENWRTWFRNGFAKNVPDNDTYATCHIVVPDNSQFWVTFEVCVVRVNSITIYRNAIVRASCRRSGGAVIVQAVTQVAGEGPLIATFDVKPGTLIDEPGAYLETTLPISVGNHFNISVSATATNVTLGT